MLQCSTSRVCHEITAWLVVKWDCRRWFDTVEKIKKGAPCTVNVSAMRLSEYCNMETFRARCQHGDVIVMETALFGRMRVGRCITSDAYLTALQQLDPTSLGCSADVLGYVDRVCSGRSACDVSVASPELHQFRPCPEQLTMYLEATYSCLTGQLNTIQWLPFLPRDVYT